MTDADLLALFAADSSTRSCTLMRPRKVRISPCCEYNPLQSRTASGDLRTTSKKLARASTSGSTPSNGGARSRFDDVPSQLERTVTPHARGIAAASDSRSWSALEANRPVVVHDRAEALTPWPRRGHIRVPDLHPTSPARTGGRVRAQGPTGEDGHEDRDAASAAGPCRDLDPGPPGQPRPARCGRASDDRRLRDGHAGRLLHLCGRRQLRLRPSGRRSASPSLSPAPARPAPTAC